MITQDHVTRCLIDMAKACDFLVGATYQVRRRNLTSFESARISRLCHIFEKLEQQGYVTPVGEKTSDVPISYALTQEGADLARSLVEN